MAEQSLTVERDAYGFIVSSRCGECNYPLVSPTDYHPPAFCVLFRAGHDPIVVVNEAAPRMNSTLDMVAYPPTGRR